MLLPSPPPIPRPPHRHTSTAVPTEELSGEPTAAPTTEPTPLPTESAVLPPPTIPANYSDAFQQALTHRRNGDYIRAATTFRAACKLPTATFSQAQLRLGESLYLAGDFTNAVPALQAVVESAPDDASAASAHYWLSDIFNQQQKYDQALDESAPREKTVALMGVIDREIGDILLANGDSNGALQSYTNTLKDVTFTPAQRITLLKTMAQVYSSA